MKGATIQSMNPARGFRAGYRRSRLLRCLTLLVLAGFCTAAWSAEKSAAAHFRKEVQPILTEYCYDCHGDGANKGKVAFDEFKSDDELLAKRDLWMAVLKNVRTGLMPQMGRAH